MKALSAPLRQKEGFEHFHHGRRRWCRPGWLLRTIRVLNTFYSWLARAQKRRRQELDG